MIGLTPWGIFTAIFIIGIAEGIYLHFKRTTGKKILAGHFSLWHIVLLIILLAVSGYWLPLAVLFQDFFSNSADYLAIKQKGEKRYFGDWIRWPRKKLVWPGIPRAYYGLIFLQLSIEIYFKDVLKELF